VNDEPRGDHAENDSDDSVADPFFPREAEVSPALGTHKAGRADRANDGGDDENRPSRNFLFELSVNEWLTFLVGLGSLFVAALAYRNAADNSDIRDAIRNLSELASQAQRQADATNRQVAEMRDEQRPWLQVVPQIKGPLVNNDGRLVLDIGLAIKNSGRTHAVSVMGKTQLKARDGLVAKILGSFHSKTKGVDVLKSICKDLPNDIWKSVKANDDTGADIIFPGGDDVILVEAATDYVKASDIPSKEGLWSLDSTGEPVPSVNLVFCVTYKAVGEDDSLHTGGVISYLRSSRDLRPQERTDHTR
jgi:hypothetical protein